MGPIKRTVAIVVAAAALLPNSVRPVQAAPSFDCRRAATVVEKTICHIPELADLDRDIALVYAQALGVLSAGDADALRADQRGWLKVRDDCGYLIHGNPAISSDVFGCLADRMATRVTHLQAILTRKQFFK